MESSGELAKRVLGLPAAHVKDEILDRDLGAVADDRVDVVGADASLAACEERKLGDFGARHGLVGAEPRHEIGACVAVDLEIRLVELLVDQVTDRALVAVARQRRRRLVALEQFAQSGVGPERASFDDKRAGERCFEQRLQRGNVDARAGCDAHHLAVGEHGDGAKLDLEPCRILREILLVETNDLHRILALSGKDIGERRGALSHEAGVRPVDEPGAA